jgi:hypothetical protein
MREFSTDLRLCGRAPALGRFTPGRFLVMRFRRVTAGNPRSPSLQKRAEACANSAQIGTHEDARRSERPLEPMLLGCRTAYCGGAPPGSSGAVLGPDGAAGALCSGGIACSDSSLSLHFTFLAFQLHSVFAVQSALPSPLQTDCRELPSDASSQALRRTIEQTTAEKRVNIGTFLHQ